MAKRKRQHKKNKENRIKLYFDIIVQKFDIKMLAGEFKDLDDIDDWLKTFIDDLGQNRPNFTKGLLTQAQNRAVSYIVAEMKRFKQMMEEQDG